ncbi:MAG: hydrogenase maturation factor [Lachnospiraceae bacterium]|nr:hydrogenase maturation factor [Lachnospiraceae bacterium]
MKVGKITGNALKRSVLKPITYRREEILNGAGVGTDCAIFAVPEGFKQAANVQEAAVAGKADMELLIGRCVNSLAVAGAQPIAAMIGLLLPETMEEPQLKALMSEAHRVCADYQMQIAGGHTTVSSAVNCPFATVTALGLVPEEPAESADKVGAAQKGADQKYSAQKGPIPGQDIVLSKWIGLEGTALLASKYTDSLLTRYPAYLVEEAASFTKYISIRPEAAIALKAGVRSMHDASEGGILAALWEMAERAGVGLSIDLKKLPIRQETVEVCEHVGANPYELRSSGCLIMTTEDGQGLVRELEAAHIPAGIVGKITDGNERLILNEDEVRYMDRPQVDEVHRLL